MSVTESKAKTSVKTSKKNVKPAEAAALKEALEAAQIELVPLSALIKSPLNVRTIPYPVESVRELAESIETIGLIQNLVVHTLPEGMSGVAAGGRRLAALQLLLTENRIDAGYQVIVKRVSDELAVVASMVENNQRVAMHPAEQIAGFRKLSEQGKSPAQIGDQLGYGSRHVQRMLKLAHLAPEILELLANNTLDVEQCQALSLESDQARQVQVYEQVKAAYSTVSAHLIKRVITETEISVTHPRFVFIGRETYEAAGGVVREDLFSQEENDGTADRVLIDRLVMEKLETAALAIELNEGWSWSIGRENPLQNYGEDRENYLLLPVPEPQYTPDEQQRLDELYATQAATETYEDEAAIQVLIDEIESQAAHRQWTDEQKASCGVVACLHNGELCIVRGIQKKVKTTGEADAAAQATSRDLHVIDRKEPDAAEGISLPLLTKMSSERTLAVQAALVQQPQKAVALMVWRLCSCVFEYCLTTRHPFVMRMDVHHSGLVSEAPTGKDGLAWQTLMQEKNRLEGLLPQGWKKDFSTFFTLDGQTLMALMAFCTACSVDGVQTREHGHTSRSNLDEVETAIGFNLRDWWQPTAENFLGLLSKNQIVEALQEAGLDSVAVEAAKLKKGDAAILAERSLSDTRWVPGWMQPRDTKKSGSTTTPDTDADNEDNTACAA